MEGHDLTTDVWGIDGEEFPTDAPIPDRARFLLQYAILAPSSHNSQLWEFVVEDETIEVHADEGRWLEMADQDKRELYISLGCAVENLRIAADRFGFDFDIAYSDDSPSIIVTLQPESSNSSGVTRHCSTKLQSDPRTTISFEKSHSVTPFGRNCETALLSTTSILS